MPGEQNPHCAALRSTKAACRSASAPLSDQPLHRIDPLAVRLHGKHQAAARDLTVEQHRACSAHAVLATQVRAGEFEFLAQEIGKMLTRLNPAALIGVPLITASDLDLVLHPPITPEAVLNQTSGF